MKLKTALEIGIECGLETARECIRNIDFHAFSLFEHSEVNQELNELYTEAEELVSKTNFTTDDKAECLLNWINNESLREENLELKMALVLMIQQFYEWVIDPEEADHHNIEYDKGEKYINCYFHRFESAGENAWKMLGLNHPIVSEKEMQELISKLEED